jgi:predicted polyphosphate/ATP-dependent NAD kinase
VPRLIDKVYYSFRDRKVGILLGCVGRGNSLVSHECFSASAADILCVSTNQQKRMSDLRIVTIQREDCRT